jgi:hypothetical protein
VKTLDKMVAVAKYLAAAAVLLSVGLVYELASDPYAPERAKLTASLTGSKGGGEPLEEESMKPLPHDKILEKIRSEQSLWRPLVKPKPRPKPKPKPPDLKKLTSGLSVLTVIMGDNNEMQAIIRDSNTRKDNIYKKGDKIRKLTVNAVASDGVVLSLEGRTIKLRF